MKRSLTPARRTQAAAVAALILFAATFAVSLLIRYGGPLGKPSDDTQSIYDWRFTTAATAEGIRGDVSRYKQATQSKKPHNPSGERYMRLSYTVKPHSEDYYLEFTTKLSPVKVDINGEEAYNNGYDSAEFSGSRYNALKLDSSDYDQQLDIYMYIPFGFEFDARLNNALTTVNYSEMIGLILGCTVAVIGILMIVASLAAGRRTKGFARMLLLAAVAILCGGLISLEALSAHSLLLSAPYWTNIRMTLNMLTVLFTYASVIACAGVKNARSLIFSLLMFAVALCCVFITGAVWVRVAYAVFALIQIVSAAILTAVMSAEKYNRADMNIFMRTVLYYVTIVNIYNSVSGAVGVYGLSNMIFTVGTGIFILAMFWMFMSGRVFDMLRTTERKKQLERDMRGFADYAEFIIGLMRKKNTEDFLAEAAVDAASIIGRANPCDDLPDIKCAAAICTNDKYAEICNNGGVENCDYSQIEQLLTDKGEDVFIGSGYIGMRHLLDNGKTAILYFENKNICRIEDIDAVAAKIYGCISAAYNGFAAEHGAAERVEGKEIG